MGSSPTRRRGEERAMTATPDPASPRDSGPKFEAAMARLEEIVHALEAGNLSLDDSLRGVAGGRGRGSETPGEGGGGGGARGAFRVGGGAGRGAGGAAGRRPMVQ